MQINGFIRRGMSGLDISFVNEGQWNKINEGAMTRTIEKFYSLLLSGKTRGEIDGRMYNVRVFPINGNGIGRTLSFSVPMIEFKLARYSHNRQGERNPSDRVSITMNFPSTTNQNNEAN